MRTCPVCSSDQRSIIRDAVMSCVDCGMVYDCDPQPYDYSTVQNYALAEPDHVRTLRTVQLLLPFMGKTILEIGCGRGELLRALSRYATVHGIDPSKANVMACHLQGLEVAQGTITDIGNVPAAPIHYPPQDLVILSHVLEHLRDVPGTLRKVHDLLSLNGHAYIEVPDATRHLDHLTVPMQEFSREHINHFSPMLLMEAIQLAGMSVVTMGTRSISYPAEGSYPAVYVIAGKNKVPAYNDPLLPRLMKEYSRKSEEKLHTLADQVRAQLHGEHYQAWGAGVLAEHLLPLLPQPLAIVDRDQGKQGTVIHGVKVTAPPPKSACPIFVCSIIGKESILRSIREAGLTQRVITL